jgi:hypothetical protein
MIISCNYYLYYEGFVGIAPGIRVICSYNFTHGGVRDDLATTLQNREKDSCLKYVVTNHMQRHTLLA